MIRVGQVFDGAAGWAQRVAAGQLLDRLPRDRYAQSLAVVHPAAIAALKCNRDDVHIARPLLSLLPGSAVARFASRSGINILHTWGVEAARAARVAPGIPVVLHLFDPVVAARESKRVRAIAQSGRFAVVCDSQTVRRRLVENGLAPELAVVIRPAVDFALISRCKRSALRDELGVGDDEYLAVLPEPATRRGGHLEASWAVTLQRGLGVRLRVILPGVSREQQRIVRFLRAQPVCAPIIETGNRHAFEELTAISDILLMTPRGDVATNCVAWAMASETAVVSSAVHSVAELIAHKVNGVLFKKAPGSGSLSAIVQALSSGMNQVRTKEVARGQAYEVFSLRRFVDQMERLYENVLNGAPAGNGITDPAMDV